jgi:ribosomal protein L14E/L6E/L27E
MDIERSDVVISLNGRDKGKAFFVVGTEELYALLCDGKSRRIDKPKRKKLKHLRFQSKSDCRTAVKIRNGEKITNSEVRKALAEYALAGSSHTERRADHGDKGGM